jgi:hypothetical protein
VRGDAWCKEWKYVYALRALFAFIEEKVDVGCQLLTVFTNPKLGPCGLIR